jgi:hypothetical protein
MRDSETDGHCSSEGVHPITSYPQINLFCAKKNKVDGILFHVFFLIDLSLFFALYTRLGALFPLFLVIIVESSFFFSYYYFLVFTLEIRFVVGLDTFWRYFKRVYMHVIFLLYVFSETVSVW